MLLFFFIFFFFLIISIFKKKKYSKPCSNAPDKAQLIELYPVEHELNVSVNCKLASITRGATLSTVINMIGFPLIARDEIPMLKYLR